ncbi:MAG TPA: hypothetical protein VGK40_12495 [Verrucomicrobiae bacterium]|jgi:hypothetical protein
MFGNGELTRLTVRKAELLAASAAHRQELMANCARLRPVVSRVEAGVRLARLIKPLLLAGAPLLGLWAARKGRGGLWNKLRAGWQAGLTLSAVWKSFRG